MTNKQTRKETNDEKEKEGEEGEKEEEGEKREEGERIREIVSSRADRWRCSVLLVVYNLCVILVIYGFTDYASRYSRSSALVTNTSPTRHWYVNDTSLAEAERWCDEFFSIFIIILLISLLFVLFLPFFTFLFSLSPCLYFFYLFFFTFLYLSFSYLCVFSCQCLPICLPFRLYLSLSLLHFLFAASSIKLFLSSVFLILCFSSSASLSLRHVISPSLTLSCCIIIILLSSNLRFFGFLSPCLCSS